LPSLKWAASITVTSGTQLENGGAVTVRAEDVRRYERFLALESTDGGAVNPVSLRRWQNLW
jgi:hypothetical protein